MVVIYGKRRRRRRRRLRRMDGRRTRRRTRRRARCARRIARRMGRRSREIPPRSRRITRRNKNPGVRVITAAPWIRRSGAEDRRRNRCCVTRAVRDTGERIISARRPVVRELRRREGRTPSFRRRPTRILLDRGKNRRGTRRRWNGIIEPP